MSQGFQDDINLGLKAIAPAHSTIDEKQQQIVQMIKRYEVKPQLECLINQDIQGLRKKRIAFGAKPASHKWWAPFIGYERNGQMNWGISRNYTRVFFPFTAYFLMIYVT